MNIRITPKWWYWLAAVLPLAASLAPWNRSEPLSWQLVARTFLTPPVNGSILEHRPLPEVFPTVPLRRVS